MEEIRQAFVFKKEPTSLLHNQVDKVWFWGSAWNRKEILSISFAYTLCI